MQDNSKFIQVLPVWSIRNTKSLVKPQHLFYLHSIDKTLERIHVYSFITLKHSSFYDFYVKNKNWVKHLTNVGKKPSRLLKKTASLSSLHPRSARYCTEERDWLWCLRAAEFSELFDTRPSTSELFLVW